MTEAPTVTASHGELTTPTRPWAPVRPLMAMSETPKSTPAAAPSATPW